MPDFDMAERQLGSLWDADAEWDDGGSTVAAGNGSKVTGRTRRSPEPDPAAYEELFAGFSEDAAANTDGEVAAAETREAEPETQQEPSAPAVEATADVEEAPEPARDEYIGADRQQGRDKDRLVHYDDAKRGRTEGWDMGGSHRVRHSGGDASAAVYAVSSLEGGYDSAQTYDAGVLSFGIMQWTLHSGSLQKLLGSLKEGSPEGREAFQEHFLAQGIDVRKEGKGGYKLYFQGEAVDPKNIDKIVRADADTARRWAECFNTAGKDPRVQKAEFEGAKKQYHDAQQINLGNSSLVQTARKKCPKTLQGKHAEHYGKVSRWTSASPKAGALFFSMRINNPTYANAAFMKAIDAFVDLHGADETSWPKGWGDTFADLLAAKGQETLASWATRVDKGKAKEGRIDKTLRFFAQATTGPTPAAGEPPPAALAARRRKRPEPVKKALARAGKQHGRPIA